MKVNQKLQQDKKSLLSMEGVIQSYQEIAAMRMRRVKESVLQNRNFLEGLNEIYAQVDYSYKMEKPLLQKKKKDITIRKTNGKTVTILLSANTGLYGDITRKTFDLFMKDVRDNNTDIVIIGKYGKRFFEDSSLKKPFKYFDFSDSGIDEQNTKDIMEHVLKYETIVIYHGFFKDILTQSAKKTVVTGTLTQEPARDQSKQEVRYIFEPSIEDVMTFFANEILSVVFNQSVFESSLSKFASRMISLDKATVKVRNVIKNTNYKIGKLRHSSSNKEQQTLMSGIPLWSNI